MYATIRRYDFVTGSMDDVILAGRQLASAVSKAPGFVSYVILEVGDGTLASVVISENRAGLAEADRLAESWITEHLATLVPRPSQLLTGEVVVQKGM